jgi:hypothetical protein
VSGPQPPRQGDDPPLNPIDIEIDEMGSELAGDQADGDQVFYRRSDEVDTTDAELTDTELYEGLLGRSEISTIEDLAQAELRSDETDDPMVASQEGLAYVPPMDPPVATDPDDPQGLRVAAGFGMSADDEPYDSDHHSELLPVSDEFEARIREALRADASTTAYADLLAIGTRNRTVAVRGLVDDIDDSDNVVDVISRVTGVDEVIDELEIRGVTD